jgi:hypothetical protein
LHKAVYETWVARAALHLLVATRSLYAFLADALDAHARGDPVPLLA